MIGDLRFFAKWAAFGAGVLASGAARYGQLEWWEAGIELGIFAFTGAVTIGLIALVSGWHARADVPPCRLELRPVPHS